MDMGTGLQEIFKQNAFIIVPGCISFIVVLGGIIIKLILRIDKKREDNNKEREDNNKERFTAGEKRFEQIEKGQKEIIKEIRQGQKEDQKTREEIKNSVSNIEKGLLILQVQHEKNHGENEHNRRTGDKK